MLSYNYVGPCYCSQLDLLRYNHDIACPWLPVSELVF